MHIFSDNVILWPRQLVVLKPVFISRVYVYLKAFNIIIIVLPRRWNTRGLQGKMSTRLYRIARGRSEDTREQVGEGDTTGCQVWSEGTQGSAEVESYPPLPSFPPLLFFSERGSIRNKNTLENTSLEPLNQSYEETVERSRNKERREGKEGWCCRWKRRRRRMLEEWEGVGGA